MHRGISLALIISLLGAMHLGAVVAVVFHFSWGWLFWTLAAWQFFALIGISVCLHREVTHRTFESILPLKLFHLCCALVAGQAGPLTWAKVHRAHHRFSDTEEDVHSPTRGFWRAHLGWVFENERRASMTALKRPPADLLRDPWLRYFEAAHLPAQPLMLVLLYCLGGWPAVCWLGCARVVLTLHSAWAINSWGHMCGYRNHATPDESRNSRVLAAFTAGEGFHNNHHYRPRDANLAHRPGEFDPGYAYIRTMRALGLVSRVRPRLAADAAWATQA